VIAERSGIASPQVQQDNERHQNILRSFWDGRGAIISTEALLRDPEFRTALGVSDEFYREILASVRNAAGNLHDNPEYREAMEECLDALEALTGQRGLFGQSIPLDGDEKTLNRLREADQRLQSMRQEFLDGTSQRHTAAFEEALTPELKQKIQESWLAAMGETSMFSPSVFEVLNLTDAQRELMERIKKELEPELEKHLEIYGRNAAMILERVNTALRERQAELASFVRVGNAQEGLGAFLRALQEEPEHKRLLDESYASSKAFATLFRTRMSEILTDGQRWRLQGLIDNPPPHARLLIQRLQREQWGQYEVEEETSAAAGGAGRDIWVPGAGAWRPGDHIPGTYRRDTRGNFPRQEN